MADTSNNGISGDDARLHQEALLVEYQQLDGEAADEARRLGVLAALVYTGWLVALGFVLDLDEGTASIVATSVGAGAALLTTLVLSTHRTRQAFMRRLMYARQTQIEEELGIYKSRNA